MGLFNIFKSKRYDMDTLDGINAIPVPAKDYHTGKDTQDCIYYLLQRKATDIKKQDEWIVLLHACENQTHYLIMSNGHY